MKPITLHVEGGSAKGNRDTNSEMRGAFRTFLNVPGNGKIVLYGSRSEAYKEFKQALEAEPERHHLLLVDSERLVENESLWQHVLETPNDKWQKPKDATEDQLFFMAQCVEAWVVADVDQLRTFYGEKLGNLSKATDIEQVSKNRLAEELKRATKPTGKGEYHKTRHLPDLLKRAQRDVVRKRASHCDRLLRKLHGE